MTIIGKAKVVKREDLTELFWPVWEVILKLSRLQVRNCSWSMFVSPGLGIIVPDFGGDGVCNPLDCVGHIVRKDSGVPLSLTMIKEIIVNDSTIASNSIAKMERATTCDVEFVSNPVKGWILNLGVDSEELIHLFPSF